jgi:uncharacterized repeat protein (TIGR03803 family)
MTEQRNEWDSIFARRRYAVRAALAIATVLVLAGLATEPAWAQTYTVLYSFTGGDNAIPNWGVIADAAGNLYGTADPFPDYAATGVVFKLDQAGNETILSDVSGGPYSSVIRDKAGNLYGTAVTGGSFGWGDVFKLNPAGKLTVLYNFTGGADGGWASSGLTLDAAGNLYGTTQLGGAYSGYGGYGVVFMVDAAGNETVLHTFNSTDGADPTGGMIRDEAGNLYGTTLLGGAYGYGAVFKLDTSGNETVLYSFTGGADGSEPSTNVIRDAAGNLYGNTAYGGAGFGVVFEVTPTGVEHVLYTFAGGADGATPSRALVRDATGNLYGTAFGGGSQGQGVVFMVTPSGREKILHTFTGTDGASPLTKLLPYKNALYGTTSAGGAFGYGVVFKLTLR